MYIDFFLEGIYLVTMQLLLLLLYHCYAGEVWDSEIGCESEGLVDVDMRMRMSRVDAHVIVLPGLDG